MLHDDTIIDGRVFFHAMTKEVRKAAREFTPAPAVEFVEQCVQGFSGVMLKAMDAHGMKGAIPFFSSPQVRDDESCEDHRESSMDPSGRSSSVALH